MGKTEKIVIIDGFYVRSFLETTTCQRGNKSIGDELRISFRHIQISGS